MPALALPTAAVAGRFQFVPENLHTAFRVFDGRKSLGVVHSESVATQIVAELGAVRQ